MSTCQAVARQSFYSAAQCTTITVAAAAIAIAATDLAPNSAAAIAATALALTDSGEGLAATTVPATTLALAAAIRAAPWPPPCVPASRATSMCSASQRAPTASAPQQPRCCR
jgi:hypothetical protein